MKKPTEEQYFLDEIAEIPPSTQVKLLRVLQEREIVRVGGTKAKNIDVRVITATNIDLEEEIKNGRFRKDLYYRLNVYPIKLPSLRARKGDIYELTIFFIKKLNQQYGRNIQDIDSKAMQELEEHDWPGNVRELENAIGRAIINMKLSETVIRESHLPFFERQTEKSVSYREEPEVNSDVSMDLQTAVEAAEKKCILRVLEKCGGNKTNTAKTLDISLRSLYYKLQRYEIE